MYIFKEDLERLILKNKSNGNTKEKLEKLFELPSELFSAIDYTNMGIINEKTNKLPRFIIGENYSLKGVSCDGFDMPEKVYKLIGIVNEYAGVNVDSVIVKQVGGERGQIFTLSKNDCAQLGIEYENGLQLFPKKMSWTRVKDKVDFDSNNLGTTPRSNIDNTIRHIVIKINGFKDYSDGFILSPSGRLINEKKFAESIRVINNEPIVYGNGFVIPDKVILDARLITPKDIIFNHGNFISSEDEMFLLISLQSNVNFKGFEKIRHTLIDDCYGVEPQYLDGVNPKKLFTIAWDEFACLTIDEYERDKSERLKREKEKIRKQEEERKKIIEAQEKCIKEQKRREQIAIDRMRKFDIKMPTFPTVEITRSYNPFDSVSSVEMYVDSIENYFDKLTNTLSNVDCDLTKISEAMYRTISEFNLNKNHTTNSHRLTMTVY